MVGEPERPRRPVPVPRDLPGEGRRPRTPADAAFNHWLQRGLHKMYDDTTSEPIPDELLQLIQRDREK